MCRMNTFMSDPNSAWKDLGKPPSHKSGARYPDAVYSGGRNEFVFAIFCYDLSLRQGDICIPCCRLFELPMRSDLVWSDLVFQCLSGIGGVPNWIKGNLTRRP